MSTLRNANELLWKALFDPSWLYTYFDIGSRKKKYWPLPLRVARVFPNMEAAACHVGCSRSVCGIASTTAVVSVALCLVHWVSLQFMNPAISPEFSSPSSWIILFPSFLLSACCYTCTPEHSRTILSRRCLQVYAPSSTSIVLAYQDPYLVLLCALLEVYKLATTTLDM